LGGQLSKREDSGESPIRRGKRRGYLFLTVLGREERKRIYEGKKPRREQKIVDRSAGKRGGEGHSERRRPRLLL